MEIVSAYRSGRFPRVCKNWEQVGEGDSERRPGRHGVVSPNRFQKIRKFFDAPSQNLRIEACKVWVMLRHRDTHRAFMLTLPVL